MFGCHGPIAEQDSTQVVGMGDCAFTRAHTMYLKTGLTLCGVRYAMVVIIARPGTYATYVRCGGENSANPWLNSLVQLQLIVP